MKEELGKKLFPQDVIEDDSIMSALLVAAQRINYIRKNRPKYLHICDISQQTLQYFFSCISERYKNQKIF